MSNEITFNEVIVEDVSTFKKGPRITEEKALSLWLDDGNPHPSKEELVEASSNSSYDRIMAIYNHKQEPVKKARNELLKKTIMNCKRYECMLGVCKDKTLQDWSLYEKFLKEQIIKANPPKPKPEKKQKKANDWYITIAFDDKTLLNEDGSINFKELVTIMTKFQSYSWIKKGDYEKFSYMLECRDKKNDNQIYHGLHVHITVYGVQKAWKTVIDEIYRGYIGKDGGDEEKGIIPFISDKPKIHVEPIWDGFSLFQVYQGSLKNDEDKRRRQIDDRELQLIYNSYITKDNIIKSLVVPLQEPEE